MVLKQYAISINSRAFPAPDGLNGRSPEARNESEMGYNPETIGKEHLHIFKSWHQTLQVGDGFSLT